ncbi:sugar ABC transporter substrate-binding protein [Cetobacterium sp.]|uniref:sugar ABC transporter substrate-binding protein n=1 Tax=Cetobacterium sp. TaxID=2071632 RepID=UPI003F3069B5
MIKMLSKVALGLAVASSFIYAEEVKPEAGAKLKVWESEGPELKWIEYVGAEFNKKYGIKIETETVAMTETVQRLEQDGPVGTGADVIVMPHDRIGSGITSGVIMPNYISGERINTEFLVSAKNAVSWMDGQLYGFPLSIETYVMFYNKDLLPNGITTFENLKAWDKENKFTDKKQNKFGFVWEVINLYYGQAFLANQGGYLIGKNGTDKNDIGANNEGAVKGLVDMMSLKEISINNPGDINYDSMMGLFRDGKIATMLNGPWAIEGLRKAGVNFGIQKIPTLNGKALNPFSGIRILAVSSYTKYPKASQLFADFATSDEMLKKRYEMTKQIPPTKSITQLKEISSNEFVNPILEQAMTSTPMPSISEMGLFWDPLSSALNDVYLEKAEPKEALDKAVKVIKDQISLQN